MKKQIIKIITIILVLFTLTSCAKKVSVTFMSDDEIVHKDEIKKDELVKEFSINKEKYNFLGWYNGDSKFDFTSKIESDLTLTAHWEYIPEIYTIEYELDGGVNQANAPTSYVENTGIEHLPTPTKEHYNFIGWYIGDKLVSSISDQYHENITLVAKWDIVKLTYTFTSESVKIKELTVDYGTIIEKPEDPTNEGYRFLGWFNGEEEFVVGTEITNDVAFEAHWEYIPKTFTISYELNEGKNNDNPPTSYVEGVGVATLPTPTKEGSNFLGWYLGETLVSSIGENQKTNLTLVAKWEIIKYTYKFVNDDDTVLKEETVEYGTIITAPTENPTKEEDELYTYEFKEWDKSFDKITSDIVIKAIYTKTEKVIYYEVKFYNATNEVEKTEQVLRGTTVNSIDVTKESNETYNYEFGGWYTDSSFATEYDFTSKVMNNLNLYPKFNARRKTLAGSKVSFLGDSITTFYASGSPMNSYYSGTNQFYYPIYSATIKTVEKTWWAQVLSKTNTVLGINESWSGSMMQNFGNESKPDAAMNYSRINHLDDAGQPDIVIIHIGTNDIVGKISTTTFRDCYTTMISRVKEVCPNAAIFVVTLGYSIYEEYKDSLRLSCNDIIREIAEQEDLGVIEFASVQTAETRANMLGDFLHPSYDGAVVMSDYAKEVMTAYFDNTLAYYKVDYELDGGTTLDPVRHMLSTATYNLPIPTKTDYNFMGWYDNPDFNGSPITKLENMTADIKLYAKFIEKPKDVIYNLNGGIWGSSLSSYFDSSYSITSTCYETNFWSSYATDVFLYNTNTNNPLYSDRVVLKFDAATGLYKVIQKMASGDTAALAEGDLYLIVSESNNKYIAYNFANSVLVGDYVSMSKTKDSLVAGNVSVDFKFYPGASFTSNKLPAYPMSESLPTPSREGYNFLGWYDNADFTGEAQLTAEYGDVLFAKWELK